MTKQHYDLRLAIACYLHNESIIIPPYYHDHIVDAFNRSSVAWAVEQAAALTLFSAFYDDVLKLEDLNYPGKIAMIWAENYITDGRIDVDGIDLKQINPSGLRDQVGVVNQD